jgi:hypothetical protein
MQWARFAAVSVFDLSANEYGCDVGGCDALTWMIKLSDVYGNEIMHVQLAVCWKESTALFSELCGVWHEALYKMSLSS